MAWKSLFTIEFNGPATEDGSMRISDLAPALLSLNDLFTKAHELVNAYPSSLSLNIHQAFTGSRIGLALVENLDPQLVNLFTPDGEAVLRDLVDLIVGPEGLLSFIDSAAGRSFEKEGTDPGPAVLRFQDGEECTVDRRIPQLYAHPRIRQYAYGVLQPLEREGITHFSTGALEIGQSRLVYFDPPAASQNGPSVVVRDVTLIPETIQFMTHNRWRLSDGETVYVVQIEDERFLERLRRGDIAVAATDHFRVRLRSSTWQNTWGSRQQHVVEEVLEHRSRSGEPSLFGPA
jgi:hypothetical protein